MLMVQRSIGCVIGLPKVLLLLKPMLSFNPTLMYVEENYYYLLIIVDYVLVPYYAVFLLIIFIFNNWQLKICTIMTGSIKVTLIIGCCDVCNREGV